MTQPANRTRSWITPIWFMVGIMIITCIKNLMNLILFKVSVKAALNALSGTVLFIFMLWPLILLGEAIIYWVIRKRIRERKWVWAHLLFSLFAFVLLFILRFLIFVLVDAYNPDLGHTSIRYLNNMEFYGFWSCLVIGHIFFIVAIVRNYSNKSSLEPDNNADILSGLSD